MTSPARAPSAPACTETEFARREEMRLADRVARYDLLAEARRGSAERHRYYYAQVHRLVQGLIPPGSRVLDVGCGLGDLVASIAAPSVGIDVSPRMIAMARERHPELDLRVLDVEHDPLPEGAFDAVVLSNAVGHLSDIQ